MKIPLSLKSKLTFAVCLSTALLMSAPSNAHEVVPSIADMEVKDGQLVFDLRMNVENFISGVDLSSASDTNDTPQALDYDRLRALPDPKIKSEFESYWPLMAAGITILIDGERAELSFEEIRVEPTPNLELPRTSFVTFEATLPKGAAVAEVRWLPQFGVLVLRQNGVEDPYEGFLSPGASTGPIPIDQSSGGGGKGLLGTLRDLF